MKTRLLALALLGIGCASSNDTPDEKRSVPDRKSEPRKSDGLARAEATRSQPREPESSPVPPSTKQILEQHLAGALDTHTAALALERQLAAKGDAALEAGTHWSVSEKRALVRAVLGAGAPLRSELARLEDELAGRETTALIASDLAAGKLLRAVALATRSPCASWASVVWERLERERRQDGERRGELLEVSALPSPVPVGGFHIAGLTIKADGDDGLAAEDVDRNVVWEYRARTHGASLRLATAIEGRALVFELGEKTALLGLDAATGSEAFRVEVDVFLRSKLPIRFALLASDAFVGQGTSVECIDIARGALAWRRSFPIEMAAGGPAPGFHVERDRIALDLVEEKLALDLVTGRRR